MKQRNQKAYLVSLAFVQCCMILFVISCGAPSTGGASQPGTGTLRITRSNTHVNYFPPFTRTIDDPIKATKLYNVIQALPHFPSKAVYACPNDTGLQYQLTFFHTGATEQQVILYASGCKEAILNHSDARILFTDQKFWPLLAQTFGVSMSDLFPQPLNS